MTSSLPPSTGSSAAFDPLEFFELSKTIAQPPSNAQPPSEVCLRTAIGRAYYSVFLFTRTRSSVEALLGNPIPNASHDYVLKTVRDGLKRRDISSKLWRLKELRINADYKMSPDIQFQDWEKNWNDAQVLVTWLIPKLKLL